MYDLSSEYRFSYRADVGSTGSGEPPNKGERGDRLARITHLLPSILSWLLVNSLAAFILGTDVCISQVGQQHHLIRSVKTGDTCYVMPKFDLEKYLTTIQRYGVSSLSFVPPIAVLLAKSPVVKNYDLSSVKYVLAGGAPLGEKLAAEAELAINPTGAVKIRQAWGKPY
jgi:acyl-CoA synthetase (AMP-forming)/AMP-acid ligase II